MRFFEVALYSAIIIILGMNIIFLNKRKKWHRYIDFLPLLLVIGHLLFEGLRWQMFMAYIFVISITVASSIKLIKPVQKRVKRLLLIRIIRSVILTFFCLSIVLLVLFPVFDLPEPEGPYHVGLNKFYFVEDGREEIFTKDEGDVRELKVTTWYPVDEFGHEVKAYWTKEDLKKRVYEDALIDGNIWYGYMSQVRTNSQLGLKVSNKKASYPVIIYSHSLMSSENENTMLCEELASQGYIVVSIAHTYENNGVLLSDGRVLKSDIDYIRSLYGYSDAKEFQRQKDFADAYLGTKEIKAKKEILKEFNDADQVTKTLIEERVKDVVYILDQLEIMNEKPGLFNGVLDLENIGIVGWSIGGATGIEAGVMDERIKVVVNMDGSPVGSHFINDLPIDTPLLYMISGEEEVIENGPRKVSIDMLKEAAQAECHVVKIDNTGHANFSDYPTYFRIYNYLGLSREMSKEKLLEIYRENVLLFLNKYLT